MPVATILTLRFAASLPTFPGSPVSFVYYKAGDAGVQLAGIAAFVLLGLYSARDTTSFRQVALWAGWFVSAGLAALSRSAMLAMAATAACFLFVISVPRVLSLAFVSAVFVVMLLTVNPEVDLGLSRNVSVTQLIANLGSITGGDDAQLDASKDWRLSWWTKIYGYTIDGPYLWVGKGFGVNLATDDGFQVDEEQSLRAPHSAHLEILARAGLPGLALWALLQLAFAAAMLRAAAIARRIKEPVWIPLLGWVFVYWLAALVNGSFDVYLGGPQGGIWFWSMIGLGLALTRMVNERAAAVRDEATPRMTRNGFRGEAPDPRRTDFGRSVRPSGETRRVGQDIERHEHADKVAAAGLQVEGRMRSRVGRVGSSDRCRHQPDRLPRRADRDCDATKGRRDRRDRGTQREDPMRPPRRPRTTPHHGSSGRPGRRLPPA